MDKSKIYFFEIEKKIKLNLNKMKSELKSQTTPLVFLQSQKPSTFICLLE